VQARHLAQVVYVERFCDVALSNEMARSLCRNKQPHDNDDDNDDFD
jgi:hypothetical protein